MDDSYRSALAGGLTHVIRQLQDITEEQELTVVGTGSDARLCSTLSINGDWPGQIFLRTTENLCAKVISVLFPGIPVSTVAIEDAACELLNMVSESTRTLLSQRNIRFEVGAPSPTQNAPDILSEDDHIVRSEHMGEPIELWFVDHPGPETTSTKDG